METKLTTLSWRGPICCSQLHLGLRTPDLLSVAALEDGRPPEKDGRDVFKMLEEQTLSRQRMMYVVPEKEGSLL